MIVEYGQVEEQETVRTSDQR